MGAVASFVSDVVEGVGDVVGDVDVVLDRHVVFDDDVVCDVDVVVDGDVVDVDQIELDLVVDVLDVDDLIEVLQYLPDSIPIAILHRLVARVRDNQIRQLDRSHQSLLCTPA